MSRLRFRFIQINSRDWALELNGELLENKLGEALVFSSRTKAENRERRDAHRQLVGITDFTKTYEWEDKGG